MKRNKAAVAAVFVGVALAFSAPVFSQEAERGWYVGGSLGQMEADGTCPSGFTCDFKDTSWKLFGGYRINRNFAAEVFYADWGEISVRTGAVRATGTVKSVGIAGLGILPVGQQFELFGKLGLASSDQKVTGTGPGVTITNSNSGSDVVFGVGAAYNFARNFAVRAEFERLSDSEINIISIGVQYKF